MLHQKIKKNEYFNTDRKIIDHSQLPLLTRHLSRYTLVTFSRFMHRRETCRFIEIRFGANEGDLNCKKGKEKRTNNSEKRKDRIVIALRTTRYRRHAPVERSTVRDNPISVVNVVIRGRWASNG